MEKGWEKQNEIEHFEQIWEYRRPSHVQHTKEVWNERADEWVDELNHNPVYRGKSDQRVQATVQYLKGRGVLTREQDVIDIGCGPGRFVAQFAQSAHHVVGTDLSSRMLQYGAEYARELGVTNTSYIESDFKKADLDALGWRKRFDLVFSSITPAISGRAGLEQMMAMSRGWCFNSCFVHSRDTLQEKMAQELLGKTKEDGWNGHWHWFYALFNLLWLRGYYPETSYYTEQEEERLPADHKTAADLAARLAGDFGQEVSELEGAIFSYLSAHADEDGFVTRCRETTYGWILWNVNDRTER